MLLSKEVPLNKKDIAELKKQLHIDRCNIERIGLCYVDTTKTIRINSLSPFLTYSRDEIDRYFGIFRQTFNGKIGKKNFTLGFSEDNDFLYDLRQSKLKDQKLLDAFYQGIIESYESENDYLIAVIYGCYQTGDYYEYIHAAICPVEGKKSALTYRKDSNELVEGTRDLIIGKPDFGVLYPAFHDREADIYHSYIYTKNEKKLPETLITHFLKLKKPLTSEEQCNLFHDVVSMTLENKDATIIRGIGASLMEMVNEKPEGYMVDVDGLCDVMRQNGVSKEDRDAFREGMKEADNPEFLVNNLIDKTTKVEMDDVVIKLPTISPPSELQVTFINGVKHIIIPVSSNVYVNDILSTMAKDPPINE